MRFGKMICKVLAVFAVVCCLIGATTAQAAWTEQQILPGTGAYSGWSVALNDDGTVAVVGNRRHTTTYGTADVWTRSGETWSKVATYQPTGANKEAGYGVAIDGNVIVVGNPVGNTISIYENTGSGWASATEYSIAAPSGGTPLYFGAAVDIDGDRIAVGDSLWTGTGTREGRVYVLEKGASWATPTTHMVNSSDLIGVEQSYFGSSVGISGDTLLVGAWKSNDTDGAAYIYERGTTSWDPDVDATAAETIFASPGTDINFGISVDIDGDMAIVGAYQGTTAPKRGEVFIYEDTGSGWGSATETQLSFSDHMDNDYTGTSVDIQGERVIVGAKEVIAGRHGKAYIFGKGVSGWVEEALLRPSDGASLDNFGQGVGLGGDYAIVGAHLGKASYIFKDADLKPGDTDGDYDVDADDAAVVASFWLQTVTGGASEGDFDGSGVVDDIDATIMAVNWSPATPASVPEPTALVSLLTLVLAGLLAYRRR